MIPQQKKKIEIAAILAVLLISVGALIYMITYEPPKEGNEYFTQEPETWLEDRYETSAQQDVEVNVYRATRTNSIVDTGRQDYYTKGDIISFFYTGFYKGDTFTKVYAGTKEELFSLLSDKPTAEQEAIVEENAIMRIDSKMNPSDGIIDSFVLAREENNRFVFYIFLDEDWKNKVEYTNILWGDDFYKPATMHTKAFDFSESNSGIYVNRIDEDVDWNELRPVKGGLMVGEVDKEVLRRLTAYEEFDETFIMVR